MANRPRETDQALSLIQDGHFGDSALTAATSGDPVTSTLLVLTLDQLVEYDGNPRRAPNAEHEAIKASYRQTGATQTLLVVTRRPGETVYFPAAGGNTRLRVLRELWQETGSEYYYRLHCKFVPFTDDTRILIHHLSENDNRSGYVFLDRARAVVELWHRLNRDQETPLSQRKFIDQVREFGYPRLSRAQLARFEYAVQAYAHIPQALEGGLHDRAIRRLQETQQSLRHFLRRASSLHCDLVAPFDRLWGFALSELDDPDGFDPDDLVVHLFRKLAPVAGEGMPDRDEAWIVDRFRQQWTRWRRDPSHSVSLRRDIAAGSDPSARGTGSSPPSMDSPTAEGSRTNEPYESAGFSFRRASVHSSEPPEAPPGSGADGPPTGSAPVAGEGALPPPSPPVVKRMEQELDELYDQLTKPAQAFAESWDIGHLWIPVGKVCAGYVMDLPDSESGLQGRPAVAWWLLWDLSGIAENPQSIPQHLDHEFRDTRFGDYYRRIAQGKTELKKRQLDSLPPTVRERRILAIFRYVIESHLPRPGGYLDFFLQMAPDAYEIWTRLLQLARQALEMERALTDQRNPLQ